MSKLDPLPGISPYPLEHFYDEMYADERSIRPHYKHVSRMFNGMSPEELQAKQKLMQRRMMEEGITFTLYNPAQDQPMERTIPFDMIPGLSPRVNGSGLRLESSSGLQHLIYLFTTFIMSNTLSRMELYRDG